MHIIKLGIVHFAHFGSNDSINKYNIIYLFVLLLVTVQKEKKGVNCN